MNKVNPEMIVLARDLCGMTQADLADALKVTQATVSMHESGLIDVPNERVAEMALLLHRPESFFYWQDRLYGDSCLYHRKNRNLSAYVLRVIHAKVNFHRIQAARLLKQARIKSTYSFHRLDPNKHRGPEGCAREMRRIWQLPAGPIRNVVRMIEGAGGMVFRCPFGAARVDGISQWALDAPELPPVFFVHEDAPGDRQRWTLCHEVGHVIMHHLPTENDPEDEANRFANELLMPASEIAETLSNMTLTKAAALKSYWKVSMQAIIVRAHFLRKISDSQYQYLFRQLSANGYRKVEPSPIPAEEPEMFDDLLEFHRKSLKRNTAQLSELLGEEERAFRAQYSRNFSGFSLVG